MKELRIIDNIEELQDWRRSLSPDTKLGFVPTMGALHQGHLQLLQRCHTECQITVLSIFVNHAQFNDPSDFSKYPKTIEADLQLAKSAGVDVVFIPNGQDMYPDDYRYRVVENDLSQDLCGLMRPGHFDGVLTIVLKLFHLVQPKISYFGEKDFQQLHLIQGMVKSLFLPIEVVAVPTVRAESGLALSSRNSRLSQDAIERVAKINSLLRRPWPLAQIRSELCALGFEIEYLCERMGRRLVALRCEDVRLIDNVEITSEMLQQSAKFGIEDAPLMLVTFGGTTEKIDEVRKIGNLSTGQTGAQLIEQFLRLGFRIHALQAQVSTVAWSWTAQNALKNGDLKITRFNDFKSLDFLLNEHLRGHRYCAVVHLAAVSDFSIEKILVNGQPIKPTAKISSTAETMTIHLHRNEKLLQKIKQRSKNSQTKVIGFKFIDSEDPKSLEDSLNRIFENQQVSKVVQNSLKDYTPGAARPFRVYSQDRKFKTVFGAIDLASELASALTSELESELDSVKESR